MTDVDFPNYLSCHRGETCRCMCHQEFEGRPLAYHCMPCCQTCTTCGTHYREPPEDLLKQATGKDHPSQPEPTPEERLPAGYLSREQRQELFNSTESVTHLMATYFKHADAAELLLEQKDREISKLRERAQKHKDLLHGLDAATGETIATKDRLLEECAAALRSIDAWLIDSGIALDNESLWNEPFVNAHKLTGVVRAKLQEAGITK